MAKRATGAAKPKPVEIPVVLPPVIERPKALVFVSHDNRDAELAAAFGDMLTDVSGGTLKSFRSTDKSSDAGIGFGAEWYSTIMSHLAEATDVVALLTQQSINRPWILYEAGVAKGKLDSTVFGVALGIPLEQVSVGPFGQFQNCSDDEDSLTKLVIQLLRRNPDAAPREAAVRLQVALFREKAGKVLEKYGSVSTKQSAPVEANAAKLFEEVKAMVRDLPERLDELSESRGGRRGEALEHIHPRYLDDLMRGSRGEEGAAIRWLMLVSTLSGDFPWLNQVGTEFYRALRSRHLPEMRRAKDEMHLAIELAERTSKMFPEIGRGKGRHVLKQMHMWVEIAVELTPPVRKIRRVLAPPEE